MTPSVATKVTVPVGVPAPGATGATVAEKVTDSPTTDGSGVVLTAVVVNAGFTVWVSVPLDVVKLESPLYVAVTVCVPALKALVVTLAVPPESVAVSVGPPVITKVTVPVGVPAPGETGATVAVKVTGCPTTDGSGAEMTEVVVEAWPTVWVSVPTEPLKSASP
ncbi:hypothetical protein NE399_11920, partial [Streptomyces sp. Isolate_219]